VLQRFFVKLLTIKGGPILAAGSLADRVEESFTG